MKRKPLFLLVIASLFLLSACEGEGGGFAIVNNNGGYQPNETEGVEKTPTSSDYGYNGGSGSEGDEVKKDNSENDDEKTEHENIGGGTSTPLVEIETKITIFKVKFVEFKDGEYANLRFDSNPFAEQYDFSYYTINENKLEQPSFFHKEDIDDTEIYSLYFGENNPGLYVIKYFNSEDVQYGTSELNIKIKNITTDTSFFSMAINILQVRLYSVGHSIQMHFKSIGEAFRKFFESDRINL